MNAEELEKAREETDLWLREVLREFAKEWLPPVEPMAVIEVNDGTDSIAGRPSAATPEFAQ